MRGDEKSWGREDVKGDQWRGCQVEIGYGYLLYTLMKSKNKNKKGKQREQGNKGLAHPDANSPSYLKSKPYYMRWRFLHLYCLPGKVKGWRDLRSHVISAPWVPLGPD